MARPKKKSVECFPLECAFFGNIEASKIWEAMRSKHDGGDLVDPCDIEAEDVQEEVEDNGET